MAVLLTSVAVPALAQPVQAPNSSAKAAAPITQAPPKPLPPVQVTVIAYLIEHEGKNEKRHLVKEVRPSQLIEYEVTYHNTTQQPIRGFRPVMTLPHEMRYSGKATPNAQEASLDGKTFKKIPLKDEANQLLPVSRYQVLRWPLTTLSPKQNLTYQVRARVGWR